MRTYNSLDTTTGQFGPATRLSVGTDVTLTACGKRENRCLRGPGGFSGQVFLRQDDGTFLPPRELQATLTQLSGGGFVLT